jgi:hypothetical protein
VALPRVCSSTKSFFAAENRRPSKFQLVQRMQLIIVDSNCACEGIRRMVVVCQLTGAVSACASTLFIELMETGLEL